MVYRYIDLEELKSKILHAKFHEHMTSGSEVFTINRQGGQDLLYLLFTIHMKFSFTGQVVSDEKTQGQTKPRDNLFFKPLT